MLLEVSCPKICTTKTTITGTIYTVNISLIFMVYIVSVVVDIMWEACLLQMKAIQHHIYPLHRTHYQLCWGDWEMGIAISCTECSQVAGLITHQKHCLFVQFILRSEIRAIFVQLVFSFENIFHLSLNKPSMSLVVNKVVVHQNGISSLRCSSSTSPLCHSCKTFLS